MRADRFRAAANARGAWLLMGLVFACLAACAGTRLAPAPADAAWAAERWPGTTAGDLDAGYALFRRRCAGCHHLPLPAAHSEGKWTRTMLRMTPKARLTPGEHDLILRYILAVRTRGQAGSTDAIPSVDEPAGRPAP